MKSGKFFANDLHFKIREGIEMRTTMLSLMILIPTASAAGLYGFLESCINMVEGLILQLLRTGPRARRLL